MKKSTRYAPALLSLSIVLSTMPQAALAQVVARSAAVPAAVSAAAAAGAAGASAVASVPVLSPLTSLNVAALPAGPALSAPAAAPLAASAMQIPTPGPAAGDIAAEAASYAGGSEAPAERESTVLQAYLKNLTAANVPAARKGLMTRMTAALLRRGSALFDGSARRAAASAPVFGRAGIQDQGSILLPNGSRPDEQPTTPSPDRERTVRLQTYALSGAIDAGSTPETSRKVLDADPRDVAAVVKAVRRMVDADQSRYGVASSDLRLIGARRFDGLGEQADSIFIHFRQTKDNLIVNGADLSFTLKVLDGKPTVVAQTGQVFPQLDVDTQSTLSDAEIFARIAERVGIPVQEAADNFQFASEKIIYSRGAWRHVKLYVAAGLPFMVAVDLSSGLVFAWDNRTGARAEGTIAGKTVDHGPITPTAQLKNLALAFLNVTIGKKTYTTDKNGRFAADGLEIPAEGLTLKATLSGPFVNVFDDESGKTLTIDVTLKPGDGMITAVFNPDSTLNDENAIAQVSAFHKVNLAYEFLRARNLTTERMDKEPITVHTNSSRGKCNAFYEGSPSLNFFKSSAQCVNSAYDTVADHEYGHYWDDETGGIMNGGLSEGWGDTLSMYLLNNPVIGEHFRKIPKEDGSDYIRHGENTYQFNEFDEVHQQGQAWGGFTWKLRKALMKELGDEAGAALAEALVLPTMFAKASTIPAAMAQVLVNAIKKDGTIMHEDLIRSIAKIHGITLPQDPGKGFIASVVERFTAPLRKRGWFGAGAAAKPAAGPAKISGASAFVDETHETTTDQVKAFLDISARISPTQKANEAIENFFIENKERLSWSDVRLLISGLKYSFEGISLHFDHGVTRSRMAEGYLRLKSRELDPAAAADIALSRSFTQDVNESIEGFFTDNIDRLSWSDVQLLISRLKYSFEGISLHFDHGITKDRIIAAWLKRTKTKAPPAPIRQRSSTAGSA